MLAAELGFSAERQKYIGQVAAMHDIGKIAIPEIIKLERRLSAEERERMEMHTVIGAQIIEAMVSCCEQGDARLEMAGQIALSHHQHWNGSGYPRIVDGEGRRAEPLQLSREEYRRLRPLAGEEIPQSARIVALADNYDALRSARQYKPAFSHEKVAEIIRRDDRSGLSAAERFGPDLAELFEQRQGRMAEIFRDFSD
jgi:putative two-component system response regulator